MSKVSQLIKSRHLSGQFMVLQLLLITLERLPPLVWSMVRFSLVQNFVGLCLVSSALTLWIIIRHLLALQQQTGRGLNVLHRYIVTRKQICRREWPS